jgi:hypothetical protein
MHHLLTESGNKHVHAHNVGAAGFSGGRWQNWKLCVLCPSLCLVAAAIAITNASGYACQPHWVISWPPSVASRNGIYHETWIYGGGN